MQAATQGRNGRFNRQPGKSCKRKSHEGAFRFFPSEFLARVDEVDSSARLTTNYQNCRSDAERIERSLNEKGIKFG
jgi:hypothetical protein